MPPNLSASAPFVKRNTLFKRANTILLFGSGDLVIDFAQCFAANRRFRNYLAAPRPKFRAITARGHWRASCQQGYDRNSSLQAKTSRRSKRQHGLSFSRLMPTSPRKQVTLCGWFVWKMPVTSTGSTRGRNLGPLRWPA